LRDIEIGFDRPPMPIRRADLRGRQLAGRRADYQGALEGGVIDAHHINGGLRSLAEVQVPPAAHSDLAVFDANRPIFIRTAF